MTKNMLAALAVAGFATAALASVTFDPQTGIGFAGKGDVQLTFGWNNAKLQKNAASVEFRTTRTVVADTTWTCDRDATEQTLERSRTITITRQRLFDSIGRLRTQITGFNLLGYDGAPEVTVTVEGPLLVRCPDGWTVIDRVDQIDPGTLTVQAQSTGPNPVDWTDIVSPAP